MRLNLSFVLRTADLCLAASLFALSACSKAETSGPAAPGAADLEVARQLLADRSQAWWNGHALPPMGEVPKGKMADSEEWASMSYSPPGTPVLPFILARILYSRSPILKDSPFDGRSHVFVDVRSASDHYLERIPGSRSVPVRHLSKIPDDLDRNSILVVTGDLYPHMEVMSKFQAAGFRTLYCLEGGMRSWKSRDYPLDGRGDAQEYRRLLDEEREPSAEGPPSDFMGIGPLGLKALMDAGADLKIVFVGDESTYRAGRIQGAVRTALGELDSAIVDTPKDQLIAVYCGCCQGRAGGYSETAARKLRQMGYTRVLHLDGHLSAWREFGYPVITDSAK